MAPISTTLNDSNLDFNVPP